MTDNSYKGISKEALDELEKTYFSKILADIPSPTPPIPQHILDAIPRKHFDIAYADNHPLQQLDLYLPPEADERPVPLLIYTHGGGFAWGDKRDLTDTPYFSVLNHGYALACANYRLTDTAPFPAQLVDVKAAIRYLRAHASEYNLNAARFAIAGVSAGGWLSLMVATTPNIADLEDKTLGNAAYGTKVRCAIAGFPVTDFAFFYDRFRLNGINPGKDEHGPNDAFFGRDTDTISLEEARHASPISYITPQVPPLMVQAGNDDHMVPYQQSVSFAERVTEIAGREKIELKIVPGVDHSDPAFKMPSWQKQVVDFLDKYMK